MRALFVDFNVERVFQDLAKPDLFLVGLTLKSSIARSFRLIILIRFFEKLVEFIVILKTTLKEVWWSGRVSLLINSVRVVNSFFFFLMALQCCYVVQIVLIQIACLSFAFSSFDSWLSGSLSLRRASLSLTKNQSLVISTISDFICSETMHTL